MNLLDGGYTITKEELMQFRAENPPACEHKNAIDGYCENCGTVVVMPTPHEPMKSISALAMYEQVLAGETTLQELEEQGVL